MERYKYARQTLKVNSKSEELNGKNFVAEDYWINIEPFRSWKDSNGVPAALIYAIRVACENLPMDDYAVYGKIDGMMGYIVHESELVLPE